MKTKMDDADLMMVRWRESEYERAKESIATAQARADKEKAVFEAMILELYFKYDMKPDIDAFDKDGTIKRGVK